MIWKTPHFWWTPHKKLCGRLLSPVAGLFIFATWIKGKFGKNPIKAPFPVISIGNLVMGGAGKTPAVLALAQYLKEKGYHPLIVTRGYGGCLKHATLVDPRCHGVQEVGDEALLMAKKHPTYVARQRKQVIPLLKDAPASSVILLDDAHQHDSLHKDIALLVVDGGQQFGNERVFPAGPLRESLKAGLARADALILIAPVDETLLGKIERKKRLSIPLLRARLKPLTRLPLGTSVMGFAGIGYPPKFLKTLQGMNVNIKEFQSFPDHYLYQFEDILSLKERAATLGATLATTTKDIVRIPKPLQGGIEVIDIELVFHLEAELESLFFKEQGGLKSRELKFGVEAGRDYSTIDKK